MVNANARSTRWPRLLDILAALLVFNLCAAPVAVGQGDDVEPTLAKERVKGAGMTTYTSDEWKSITLTLEALKDNWANRSDHPRTDEMVGGERIEQPPCVIEALTQEWNRHYSLMTPLRSDGRSGGHYRRW